MLLAFNKPCSVISQFTPDGSGNRTLKEFNFPPNCYPLGRLDADSEGLLLLSDEPALNKNLLHPENSHQRRYWAQVERIPGEQSLKSLARGLLLNGRRTLPAQVWILNPQPDLPPRVPPIRFRKSIPTCWIALQLIEGKNRQVRRMTAAIGHPTLRLIRVSIGAFHLNVLPEGKWRELSPAERKEVFEKEPK